MTLTILQLKRIRDLVYKHTGIVLNDNKDIMIKNRLDKLINKHNLTGGIDKILALLEKGEYIEFFINSFTTNKTDFFREVHHFEDLRSNVLPTLFEKSSEIKIYSCASSTGEEPYSIAMSATHVATIMSKSPRRVKIIATDIDTGVLSIAKEGVYKYNPQRDMFPKWIALQNYFKRRTVDYDSNEWLIKAKDELLSMIKFEVLNLFDEKYPFTQEQFDVIFCRNVFIYSSTADQMKILKKLLFHLKLGGTLYLGHSESPLELGVYLKKDGNNVFRKIKN